MIKQLNRVLKLVGLQLAHTKRRAPKSESQRVKEFVVEFTGDAEWQSDIPRPENEGKTHYPGDSCPPGHLDQPRVEQPSSVNDVKGTSS